MIKLFSLLCNDFAHQLIVFIGNNKKASYNIYRTNNINMAKKKDKKRKDALKKKSAIEALKFQTRWSVFSRDINKISINV